MMTHFLSPNPDEAGTLRATWQHSVDTSAVWARAIALSSDAGFVAPGVIPWLLLEVVGAEGDRREEEFDGGDRIHRLNTAGGIASVTGCSQSANVGSRISSGTKPTTSCIETSIATTTESAARLRRRGIGTG